MDVTTLFYLSSGLFLGWSLGANDAANVFGTAVGARMVRFRTAALISSVFVTLGAVVSGGGAAHTLGRLGAVNAIPGAFMVTLSAGATVYGMTRLGAPVSTTQAIVGAIVGWNLFSGALTDRESLATIVGTWVVCPVLAGVFAAGLYRVVRWILGSCRLHVLRLDLYTRRALLLAGAFGAYSLGANNIANVMGVFLPVSPFTPFHLAGIGTVSSGEQLFLLGGLAIAAGVFTYSKRVMLTVGRDLLPLTPVAAFVAVLSHSLVLFLFASQRLEQALAETGLPTVPLVPVSSSQAVIGAVLGIGLLKGGVQIRYRVLGGIVGGWIATPVIAGSTCFVALFFLQNVFDQRVHHPVPHRLTPAAVERLEEEGISIPTGLRGRGFPSARRLADALEAQTALSRAKVRRAAELARLDPLRVDTGKLDGLDPRYLSASQRRAVARLDRRVFEHRWQLAEALARGSPEWEGDAEAARELRNRRIRERLRVLYDLFQVDG